MKNKKELLKACAVGDDLAQRQLYKNCFPFLMGICIRYAPSKEDAMDLLNIGFYKILKALKKYREEGNFMAWAKRVMINSIIDEMRRHKRYKEEIQLFEETEIQWEVESNQEWFDSKAISAEEIYMYISELPPLTASVFNLFAIDGYKHKEIAEKLNIGLSASKWHYANAKQKLQQRILAQMKSLKTLTL